MRTDARTATRPGAGGSVPPDAYWLGGWNGGKPLPADPRHAHDFLRWLNPDTNAPHAFRAFHETDSTRPPRKLWGTLDEHFQTLDGLNRQGYGIFVTVNETDGRGVKRENVTRVRAAFVDWDGQPLPDPDHHQAHAIVWTSPPRDGKAARAHGYWHASMPLRDFRLVQLGLADEFGGDESVHDLPRIMRVPGFLHQKREPYLVRLWWADYDAPPMTVADFRRAFPAVDARFVTNERQQAERERQRQRPQPVTRPAAGDVRDAMRAWFQREAAGIRDVGRHDLLKRAARHLLDNGLPEADATSTLQAWLPLLPPRADGSVPDDEARDMVAWVYANVPPGEPWKMTGNEPLTHAPASTDARPLLRSERQASGAALPRHDTAGAQLLPREGTRP